VVGFIDDDPRLRRRRLLGVPVLGTIDELPELIIEVRPDVVFVAIPNAPDDRLDIVKDACHRSTIDCHFVRREIVQALPVPELEAASNVMPIPRRGGR